LVFSSPALNIKYTRNSRAGGYLQKLRTTTRWQHGGTAIVVCERRLNQPLSKTAEINVSIAVCSLAMIMQQELSQCRPEATAVLAAPNLLGVNVFLQLLTLIVVALITPVNRHRSGRRRPCAAPARFVMYNLCRYETNFHS